MSNPTESHRPFLVLTSLMDGAARPAALTRSHADAFERAYQALAAGEAAEAFAGVDLVELSVAPKAFAALRRHLGLAEEALALYDVFPVAGHLPHEVRTISGQFLAADVLWTLEDQGLLGGVPLRLHLDVPRGWEKEPKRIHERLIEADALRLSPESVASFHRVKSAWDAAG